MLREICIRTETDAGIPALSLCMRRVMRVSHIRRLFFGYDVWLKLFHDLVHVVGIMDI